MSENPTPEPERILLHADWSTTRHEQPEPDDSSREHEAERQKKLSRERLLLLADMTAVLEPTAEETAEAFGTRQETVEWLDANAPSGVADWARNVFDRAQAERPTGSEEKSG
jgi:hypothetical protein